MQTHRGVVVARNGVVATSQPLATSAGLNVLMRGGSFIDAAIATSAVLCVVEPWNSHLGGDAFVITYDAASHGTTAWNASGAAPRAANLENIPFLPHALPLRGPRSASMPGLVDCWFRLHERFGTIPMADLLAPAIEYADGGFPASGGYARLMFEASISLSPDWFQPLFHTLTSHDEPPDRGSIIRQPDLAWTLRQIAAGGRDAFYAGPVAERMVAASERAGGLFTSEDFALQSTQISEPIRTDYRGVTIHGQPPVSQGHILLQVLNMMENLDSPREFPNAPWIHTMVEAKKLAFADRAAYLGDPEFVDVPIEELLSKEYAVKRYSTIDPNRASETVSAGEIAHDTTYFCVADRSGSAVSFIQSIFHGFGAGWIADGTGVLFNNRMTGFSRDPSSQNVLAGGKRTAHTLTAWLATRGDKLAWIGGTPGGDVQVQSNAQIISNVVDFGMSPQEAIEAPRWQHAQAAGAGSGLLEIEDRIGKAVVADLQRRGHAVLPIDPWSHGSRVQLIAVDADSSAYFAGSDPRCEGHAAGF